MPTLAEDVSTFFADLGVSVTWTVGLTAHSSIGLLDSPDAIDGGLLISTEYKLTMEAAEAVGILKGQAIVVDGTSYIVRESPRGIDDGKLVTMELSK